MNQNRRRMLGAMLASNAPWAWAQKAELRGAELHVVYFENLPPFSIGKGSAVGGLFIDVLNEALGKRLGMDLTHRGLPWARAQNMVQQGQADAFISLVTPQRRSYATAGTVPIYTNEVHAYAAADHPRLAALRAVTDPRDYEPYTIATYVGNSLAATAFAHMRVQLAGTAEGSVQMALARRVDLVPGELTTMRLYLRNLGVPQDALVRLDPVLARLASFLQIRKTYPHATLAPESDTVLQAMRADGTLDAIIARYLN